MRHVSILIVLGLVLGACSSSPRPLSGAKILNDDGKKAQAWSYCDKDNQNNLVYRDRDGGIAIVPRGCDLPVAAPTPPVTSGAAIPIQVPQGAVGRVVTCTWTGSAWSCPFPSTP